MKRERLKIIIMSDAYSEYCEEQRKAEIMEVKAEGLKRWNSTSDSVKREKLEKLRSDFMIHDNRLTYDLSQMNIGHAKANLINLRCFVLNALEELGIV